jgi:hypothetical protein
VYIAAFVVAESQEMRVGIAQMLEVGGRAEVGKHEISLGLSAGLGPWLFSLAHFINKIIAITPLPG